MRTPSRKSSYTLANKEQEMDARNEAIIFDSNESEKTLKLTLESDHCQANNNDKESSQNVQNVEKSSHQIIQNFVPNWFAMTLSWGATALIIRTLPNLSSYPNLFKIFDLSAKIIFFWNTLYFLLFLGILFYPKPENLRQNLVRKIIEHPIKSNFLALIPMTFGVWVTSIVVLFGLNEIGFWLFWVDLFFSYFACVYLNYRNITNLKSRNLPMINSVYLFPNLPNIVAAAAGATILPFMENNSYKIYLMIASYISLGIGFSLSLLVLAVYFVRLLQKGWPGLEIANSVWVVIGPIGHSANTILQLGRHINDMEIGGQNETITCINKKYFQTIQQSVLAPSLLTGLFLWGFALFWFFIAALTLYQHTSKIKFNLSFWGIIFPIATFTFSTYQLTIITGMVLFKFMSIFLMSFILMASFCVHFCTLWEVLLNGEVFWGKFK